MRHEPRQTKTFVLNPADFRRDCRSYPITPPSMHDKVSLSNNSHSDNISLPHKKSFFPKFIGIFN